MAVATLAEIAADPEARHADRIAASRALISGAQNFAERKMLERTIADLERQLYGSTSRNLDALDALDTEAEAEPEDE
jgi:hypothetical protein